VDGRPAGETGGKVGALVGRFVGRGVGLGVGRFVGGDVGGDVGELVVVVELDVHQLLEVVVILAIEIGGGVGVGVGGFVVLDVHQLLDVGDFVTDPESPVVSVDTAVGFKVGFEVEDVCAATVGAGDNTHQVPLASFTTNALTKNITRNNTGNLFIMFFKKLFKKVQIKKIYNAKQTKINVKQNKLKQIFFFYKKR